jgi:hypothetical protein
MNPSLVKWFKHAGFVVVAAIGAALLGMLNGDPAVMTFIKDHPVYAAFVPIVAGLLGALTRWAQGQQLIAPPVPPPGPLPPPQK